MSLDGYVADADGNFDWAVIGGGTRALRDHHALVKLELLDERRFDSGMMYLDYRTA